MEWIIVLAIILIIIAFFLGKNLASRPIQDKNNEILKRKEQLEKEYNDYQIEILKKQNELDAKIQATVAANKQLNLESDKLKTIISEQKKQNDLINKEYDNKIKTIENAKQLAEEAAAERSKILEQQFQNEKVKLEEQKQELCDNVADLQHQLESLKATKAAAIEAALKENKIKENKDDYCLILPIEERRDVDVLLDAKNKISKPRVASMAIWNGYYQQLAKTQFPRILGKQDACGIYKITNQKTGECYIGQAVDIRKRWYEHCKNMLGIDTPVGSKLCAAANEYGLENFTFEILQECQGYELNEKEKYFIEAYQSKTFGYNGTGGNN